MDGLEGKKNLLKWMIWGYRVPLFLETPIYDMKETNHQCLWNT